MTPPQVASEADYSASDHQADTRWDGVAVVLRLLGSDGSDDWALVEGKHRSTSNKGQHSDADGQLRDALPLSRASFGDASIGRITMESSEVLSSAA